MSAGDIALDTRAMRLPGDAARPGQRRQRQRRPRCDAELVALHEPAQSVEVDVMTAGGSIMYIRPGITFLVEPQRDANRPDLYIDEASLIVRR